MSCLNYKYMLACLLCILKCLGLFLTERGAFGCLLMLLVSLVYRWSQADKVKTTPIDQPSP